MKSFKLKSMYYAPGYSDMRGGGHSASLKQTKDGEWILVCKDREYYNAPTYVITYRVTPEAIGEFEDFLRKKRIPALSARPKSRLFATDYHPWSYSIEYSRSLFGREKTEDRSLEEYRLYSRRDYKLLKELKERFQALKKEKISEETLVDEEY